ncbi:beta strand repeat-containing protein, partial [Halomonas organivorans]|uniref:beta strand repeat-containing protein n=1 Tax=Halomonas organivorans TaxID=257772 RepID=UPI0035F37893
INRIRHPSYLLPYTRNHHSSLASTSHFSTLQGSDGTAVDYTIITALGAEGSSSGTDLQGVLGDLSGNYVLGSDIDASATATWTEGFAPLGRAAYGRTFTGRFDGLGHTIDGLVSTPSSGIFGSDNVALFGATNSGAEIRNIGLVDVQITGRNQVGALVGDAYNTTIDNSYATGQVNGEQNVGGLVGYTTGVDISNSFTAADVELSGNFGGGLIGNAWNSEIRNSYTSSSVTGASQLGGLIGRSQTTTIADTYAVSTVTGTGNDLGGLVGELNGGTVDRSYAAGRVTGTSNGGLIGYGWNGETVQNSFYSIDGTGQTSSAGGSGLSGVEMQQTDDFLAANWDIDAQGGTGSVWRLYEGHTTPLLRSFLTPLTVLPEYDGSGAHQTDISAAAGDALSDPRISGSQTNIALTLTGSANSGEYLASLDLDGLYSGQQGVDLIGGEQIITDGNVANAGDIALTNGISWDTGTLRIDTTGNITNIGAIQGGANSVFHLVDGNWQQHAASLPTFAVNDFRLKEDTASFLRASGGNGTATDPYQIGDVYGLQGLESYTLLGSDFTLASDIGASVTVNWHAGAGFDPIGTRSNRFSGSLDGQGHVIDGLTIDRPEEDNVGLLGRSNGAELHNVGLSDVSLTGASAVGSLVGNTTNTSIENSYAHGGQLTAIESVAGGLVGSGGDGVIQNSYADVAVLAEADGFGSGFAGGLLGAGNIDISNSYALGDVSSPAAEVGGLVGQYNAGTITNSYATGQVNGGSAVGGAVGNLISSAALSQVFWNQDTNTDLTGVGNDAAATGVTGKSLTDLQTLQTFTDAGWDIDAQGGTSSVWRLYEGHTTPLLRSFLTPLTVAVDDASTTYNGTVQTGPGSWSASGPHDSSLILGTASITGGGKDAGNYAISIDGLYSSQQGYDLVVNDGDLTIDKANATVTANSDSVTYNGTTQNVSGFTASGLVGGEDESVLTGVTTSGGSGKDAGTYTHTASGSDGNYLLTFIDGGLTINKALATVTANSDTVTYNGSVQNVSGFTASGLVGGEDEGVLTGVTTSGGTGTDAGSYVHTASGTDGNYALTFIDGGLTIDKALATVTANSDTVTYNGSNQSVTGFTASGLVGGEDESVLSGVTTSGGSGKNAGTYAHTASGSDGNYLLTFVDGELTIDKAAATVTANSDSVTYNGTTQNVSGFTASGLVGGENESVLTGVTTSGGSGKDAGTYTHTASGSDGNYLLTFVDGELAIDKAAATVTANSDSVTYNGGVQNVSGFTASGLVGGEDESVLTGVTTSGGSG